MRPEFDATRPGLKSRKPSRCTVQSIPRSPFRVIPLPGPARRTMRQQAPPGVNMSFSNLGLSAELLRAVSEQGYTEPTPVQARSIPSIITGRDLQAAAQTG